MQTGLEQAKNMTVGIIGLGLIGGSIAKALKERFRVRIIAYDPNGQVLLTARHNDIADETVTEIGEAFRQCDIVFLSAPASHNLFNMRMVMPYIGPDAILTDVTSVKLPLHRLAEEMHAGMRFVGGHPMAGKERGGLQYAEAKLLQGARYILTTSARTDGLRVERMKKIVSAMGAVPQVMQPEDHDRAVAAISHLPHVVSAALVGVCAEHDDARATMRQLAAGGFRDLTRISSSPPELWRQITLLNATQISLFLEELITKLKRVQKSLDRSDQEALMRLFQEAKEYRDSMGE
ncbi:MAG: prephenate dehydrogenase/arogenate dehydrogenase family protein [Lachnospiraceae bacterium]|nr:prephenate dehydrogenase/arogenate dehydrogenase family protein [Lachnospiraceae bacterium]